MDNITLNNGIEIPIIGFGTYDSRNQLGAEAVINAFSNGYRLIDTASFYSNEETIGNAIKGSNMPREEIVVTTKLWREYLGYASTKREFEKSLKKLDTDYIDIYLIHWPANARNYSNWQKTNADTWRAMEELQAEGKIKSIGVSNFWQEHFEALFLTANVVPCVNQVEFHPGYWQMDLLDYCTKHKIVVEAWSPLARGKVFQHEVLVQIARKYNKEVSQICLRWIIQHGVVALPKSTNPQRITSNIEIFDFHLTDEEMKAIDTLPQMAFSGEIPTIWPDKV